VIANTITSTEAAVERLLPGYRKRVVILLLLLLVSRFWLCQTGPLEITGEEAYSWMKGRNLDWGYWDQGPLTPALIRLGTYFFHDTELGVRWLAAVIATGTGFVLFYVVRRSFTTRAAFFSVVLFAVTPLFAWQGLLMTDGTVVLAIMALVMAVSQRALEENRPIDWLALGVLSGAALLTSWWHLPWVLGWMAFFALTRETREDVFGLRGALALAGILLALIPRLIWLWQPELKGVQLAEPDTLVSPWMHWHVVGVDLLVKYWAVWLLPVSVLGFLGWMGSRHAGHIEKPTRQSLLWIYLSVPGLVAEGVASFFHAAQPSVWLPQWLPLVPLAVLGWEQACVMKPWVRRAGYAVFLLATAQTIGGWVPQWSHRAPCNSSLYVGPSWRTMAQTVVRTEKETGATFAITDHPFVASALSFYMPFHPFVYVVDRVGVGSQFDFWVGYRDNGGANALLVARKTHGVPEQIGREFRKVTSLPEPNLGENAAEWQFSLCEDFGGEPAGATPEPELPTDSLTLPRETVPQ
jgi:hypothetical protein